MTVKDLRFLPTRTFQEFLNQGEIGGDALFVHG